MIACSQAGLVSLTYLPKGKGTRNLVKVFSQKYGISEELLEAASNSQTKKVVKQLDKYFSGRLQTWDLELDWQLVKGLERLPYRLLLKYLMALLGPMESWPPRQRTPKLLEQLAQPWLKSLFDRGSVPPGSKKRRGNRQLRGRL